MNAIDRKFCALCDELRSLNEKELYHRMRQSFERVPLQTRNNCIQFFNRFRYWGRLEPEKGIYEEIERKQAALCQYLDQFAWLYQRLADYRSKGTLYAILNNWYCYDFASTTRAKEGLFDSYFDLDLVKCSPDEVVVDLGAYTGDSVLSYLENYGADCYKKIYCYEITPATFAKLQKNLAPYSAVECRCKGVSDRVGSMWLNESQGGVSANALAEQGTLQVPVTTLDADIAEPITLIKADIEGGEQKALLGAKQHIIDERPKLLISVYHRNEDLWQIPRMIEEFCPDYRFYLRYQGSPIYPTEIILLAL